MMSRAAGTVMLPNGDVANHRERLADDAGGVVNAKCHNEHRQISREHRAAVENFLLESLPVAQVANDKDGADGEDSKGVDDIQHSSIEHSLMAEDGGYDGVAHKADIAEH